jgi:hypothetical protein
LGARTWRRRDRDFSGWKMIQAAEMGRFRRTGREELFSVKRNWHKKYSGQSVERELEVLLGRPGVRRSELRVRRISELLNGRTR